MSMRVIEALGGEHAITVPAGAGHLELAFSVHATSALHPETGPATLDALRSFLCYQVTRTPQDLRVHVRRILLLVSIPDGHGAHGALLDLFIVLGTGGTALRRRMLAAARPVLTPEQYLFLANRVESGLDAREPMPDASTSLLGKGLLGSWCLVERFEEASPSDLADPLREARDCLEHGQLDAARLILEKAVLETPARLELHRELLEIYRATGDLEHFRGIFQRLTAMEAPGLESWRKTEVRLALRASCGHD
ncbi:hypothetical protein CKO35_12820 [Ectothiorhodospira shaposhnikovii]|uniref:type IV pilus assembly protein FimV n=1 Tax=Ectothiorhodospira shaposhnikovii TaxID=1054 RepID=UPI00190512A7|nr:hypothetical protein [Ectothiorhodospira shaposhnikovii]MBK1674170.1 hypothetical protein [Ectothiorhodospira shaposhnikovii]